MSTLPSVRSINSYWLHRGLPEGVTPVYDAGEPSCFACGWHDDDKLTFGLERAHVIPRSVGGGDDPENLALLCSKCHKEAPDTLDADWFWRWVAKRPSDNPWIRFQARARDIAQYLSEDELLTLEAIPQDEHSIRFEAAAERLRIVHHFGVGLSAATMGAVLREVASALTWEDRRMKGRSDLVIGQKAVLNGNTGVTVVPTYAKVPADEVNVMADVTGSVMTVRISQLEFREETA